jgi:cold shock CspA family protein
VTVPEAFLKVDRPGKSPKATRVIRVDEPKCVQGRVTRFSPETGYGFIMGEDDVSYYLHSSEMWGEGLRPVEGDTVRFYSGTRENRPRACYVKVCL